ncbi:hypothetical protein, partial [Sphingobacterium deserti]|uniref:hypothetical protein n=1 Tax=Sphingobacterium deserti TaxID=1229276 RepID=UPI0012FEAA55
SPNHASTCGSAGYFYTLAPAGGTSAEYVDGKQAGKVLNGNFVVSVMSIILSNCPMQYVPMDEIYNFREISF